MDTLAADPQLEPEPTNAPRTPLGLGQWIERAALADLLAGAQAEPGVPLAHALVRHGGVVAHGSPQLRNPAFNRVFIGGEDTPSTASDVARVLDEMSAVSIAEPLVHVHPQDLHPDIEATLAARGFGRYRRNWQRFMAEPGDRVSGIGTDVQLRPVEVDDATTVTALMLSAFGLHADARCLLAPMFRRPGWYGYVACEGANVIAVGALLVRGDIGYLCFGATHPAHRRKGAQRALIDKRLRVGFALGCRRIYSETGEAVAGEPNPSFDNLVRAGMRPIGVRLNYARQGVRWS